jgi:hypothetical protein
MLTALAEQARKVRSNGPHTVVFGRASGTSALGARSTKPLTPLSHATPTALADSLPARARTRAHAHTCTQSSLLALHAAGAASTGVRSRQCISLPASLHSSRPVFSFLPLFLSGLLPIPSSDTGERLCIPTPAVSLKDTKHDLKLLEAKEVNSWRADGIVHRARVRQPPR